MILEPGLETLLDQLGDGGTGHQHVFVHVKGESGEPRLVGDVGRRHPFLHATREIIEHALLLIMRQPRIQVTGIQLVIQVEGMQHQRQCLVEGVVGAVTEKEPRLAKTARAPAHPVADGGQFVGG